MAMIFGSNDETEMIYITDETFWKKNGCCEDSMNRVVYNALCKAGLSEEMDGIWSDMNSDRTFEALKEKIIKLGFQHNQEFEDYMNSFEE